jgi:hypothetical protein
MKMSPHDIIAYSLSRQQDVLSSNRIEGLVNSFGITDRSEGRRLFAQTIHAVTQVVAIVRTSFAGVGKRVVEIFSVKRQSAQ